MLYPEHNRTSIDFILSESDSVTDLLDSLLSTSRRKKPKSYTSASTDNDDEIVFNHDPRPCVKAALVPSKSHLWVRFPFHSMISDYTKARGADRLTNFVSLRVYHKL